MFVLDQVFWTILGYSLFRFQKTSSRSKIHDARPSITGRSRTSDLARLLLSGHLDLDVDFYNGNHLMSMKCFEKHNERF